MAELKTVKLGATNLANINAINDNFSGVQADIQGKLGKTEKAESAKVADNALKVNNHTVDANVPADAVFLNQAEKNNLAVKSTVNVTGDVTGSAKIGEEATASLALTLQDVVKAGTGCKITVNAKGLVTGVAALTEADIPNIPHTKVTGLGNVATKNVGTSAGNVVVVNESGKIESSLIPKIAITDVFETANQEAMLQLTGAEVGDIAIRTDINKTFILAKSPANTLENWKELKTPGYTVQSVNGKTGAVTLKTKDIAEETNLYYTEERATANFNSNFGKKASTALSDGASILHTGAKIPAADVTVDASHKFVTDAEKFSYADKYTKAEADQKHNELRQAINAIHPIEKLNFTATAGWSELQNGTTYTLTVAAGTKLPLGSGSVYRKSGLEGHEKYETVMVDVFKEGTDIKVVSMEKFEGYLLAFQA